MHALLLLERHCEADACGGGESHINTAGTASPAPGSSVSPPVAGAVGGNSKLTSLLSGTPIASSDPVSLMWDVYLSARRLRSSQAHMSLELFEIVLRNLHHSLREHSYSNGKRIDGRTFSADPSKAAPSLSPEADAADARMLARVLFVLHDALDYVEGRENRSSSNNNAGARIPLEKFLARVSDRKLYPSPDFAASDKRSKVRMVSLVDAALGACAHSQTEAGVTCAERIFACAFDHMAARASSPVQVIPQLPRGGSHEDLLRKLQSTDMREMCTAILTASTSLPTLPLVPEASTFRIVLLSFVRRGQTACVPEWMQRLRTTYGTKLNSEFYEGLVVAIEQQLAAERARSTASVSSSQAQVTAAALSVSDRALADSTNRFVESGVRCALQLFVDCARQYYKVAKPTPALCMSLLRCVAALDSSRMYSLQEFGVHLPKRAWKNLPPASTAGTPPVAGEDADAAAASLAHSSTRLMSPVDLMSLLLRYMRSIEGTGELARTVEQQRQQRQEEGRTAGKRR
jgi:hypothetical protein